MPRVIRTLVLMLWVGGSLFAAGPSGIWVDVPFVKQPKEGCVDGVYRVRNPARFPMLLEVMLPPGWRHQPLYQRLGRAGADD